jgi:hypothetical protein
MLFAITVAAGLVLRTTERGLRVATIHPGNSRMA